VQVGGKVLARILLWAALRCESGIHDVQSLVITSPGLARSKLDRKKPPQNSIVIGSK